LPDEGGLPDTNEIDGVGDDVGVGRGGFHADFVGELGRVEGCKAYNAPAVLHILTLVEEVLLACDAVERAMVAVGVCRGTRHHHKVAGLAELELPLEGGAGAVAHLVLASRVGWHSGAGRPAPTAGDCTRVADVASHRDGAVVVHGVGEGRDVRLHPFALLNWPFDEIEGHRNGGA